MDIIFFLLMFGLIYKISRAYLNQPIRLQAHLATDWLITHQNLLIIISKSSHRAFENVLAESKATFIEDPPLEQSELDASNPETIF